MRQEIIDLADQIHQSAKTKYPDGISGVKYMDLIECYKPADELHPHDMVKCWLAVQFLQQESQQI